MKVLAAVLVTAAVLVGAAYAGNVTPVQLSALAKRVTALQVRAAALEKANHDLSDYVDRCLSTFQGFSLYGAAADGSGYTYRDTRVNADLYTSALNITAAGDTSDYWFPDAPASCLQRR